MAQRISLHGEWERWINGNLFDRVGVPSSLAPSGYYHLKRRFRLPLPIAGQRVFVHFEAIAYHGRVSINGKEAGVMGPYVPGEFEITGQMREGDNEIHAAIADLAPGPGGAGRDEIDLGHTPGWEAYGGIFRDVWIELRPATFISNVRLAYQLQGEYSRAVCQIRVYLSSAAAGRGRLQIAILRHGNEIAKAGKPLELSAGESEVDVPVEIANPALWSPDEPNLYTLRAVAQVNGGEASYECRAGFRELVIRGNRFVLNGRPLTLTGLCRHDMWKDQGFTLTPEQMRQDMRMIKALGANFVRLVHYPHDRRVVELADELGLLVTEEPGFWQVDFAKIPRGQIEAGLRVMERLIPRDWNSPSVMAWLLGNESRLTVDYLKEGKALCNRLDPLQRFVSFANSMKMEDAKPIFEQAGLDFFTQHLYSYSDDKFAKTAAFYGGSKPLVLTEWGWEVVGGPQVIYERSFDPLLAEVQRGTIAGHAFWSWQDVREYSRVDWATQDGILASGVVMENREVRERLSLRLAGLFQGQVEEPPSTADRPEITPLRSAPWRTESRFQPLDLQPFCDSEAGQKSWKELESAMEKYWPEVRMARNQWTRTGGEFKLWSDTAIFISGARFAVPVRTGYARPLILTAGNPEVSIPVGVSCRALHILGNVTLPDGYPIAGTKGAVAAVYRVKRSQDRVSEFPQRHGIEVARSNMIFRATRIDPVALQASRALVFHKDSAREHLQALLYSLPLDAGPVDEIVCRLHPEQPPLAIFAITAELA